MNEAPDPTTIPQTPPPGYCGDPAHDAGPQALQRDPGRPTTMPNKPLTNAEVAELLDSTGTLDEDVVTLLLDDRQVCKLDREQLRNQIEQWIEGTKARAWLVDASLKLLAETEPSEPKMKSTLELSRAMEWHKVDWKTRCGYANCERTPVWIGTVENQRVLSCNFHVFGLDFAEKIKPSEPKIDLAIGEPVMDTSEIDARIKATEADTGEILDKLGEHMKMKGVNEQ